MQGYTQNSMYKVYQSFLAKMYKCTIYNPEEKIFEEE